jgi:hypothetical protein
MHGDRPVAYWEFDAEFLCLFHPGKVSHTSTSSFDAALSSSCTLPNPDLPTFAAASFIRYVSATSPLCTLAASCKARDCWPYAN